MKAARAKKAQMIEERKAGDHEPPEAVKIFIGKCKAVHINQRG